MQLRHSIPGNHGRHRPACLKRNKADVVLHPRRRSLRPLSTRLVPPWQGHLQGTYPSPSLLSLSLSFFGSQGSNQKVDGSIIATVLETASVVVIYLGWKSITEGPFHFLLSSGATSHFRFQNHGKKMNINRLTPGFTRRTLHVMDNQSPSLPSSAVLPTQPFAFFWMPTNHTFRPIYFVLTFLFRFQPHFRRFRSINNWLITSLRTLS